MKAKRTVGLTLAIIMAISCVNFVFAEKQTGIISVLSDKIASGAAAEINDTTEQKLLNLIAYRDSSYAVSGGNIYFDPSTGAITDADPDITAANIPSTINGFAVTAIDDHAFWNCSRLTDITIPDSVTFIGRNAFNACVSLANVTMSDSVTVIDDYAFEGCVNLTNIILSKNITSIGQNAFYDCTSLADIVLPDKIKIINWGTFMNCSNLASITIPAGVTKIDSFAFDGCVRLTDFTISEGSTYVDCEFSTFDGCKNITRAMIPDSVTYLGEYMFYDCDKSKLVIYSQQDSYAISWAVEHGFLYEYVTSNSILFPDLRVSKNTLIADSNSDPQQLIITPYYEINYGDSIILNLENAHFEEELMNSDAYIWQSAQSHSSWEDIINEMDLNNPDTINSIVSKYVKNEGSSGLPYKMEYINPQKARVLLCPLSGKDAHAQPNNVAVGIPCYSIKLPVIAESNPGAVILTVDNNYTKITSDSHQIANVYEEQLDLNGKGDVNNDNTIDSRDSLTLFKFIAGDAVALDVSLVDFNNDNIVDSRDSLILFKYIAGDYASVS